MTPDTLIRVHVMGARAVGAVTNWSAPELFAICPAKQLANVIRQTHNHETVGWYLDRLANGMEVVLTGERKIDDHPLVPGCPYVRFSLQIQGFEQHARDWSNAVEV